jgi:site-specific DNA-methyltransferase (adenine-specific)
MQLIHGDCLEEMKKIPDGSVDMVLCDLPYGTTACKWDSVLDLPRMWRELARVVKISGAVVLTAAQPFTSVLGSSNIRDLKYDWTWQKTRATGHLNAKKMPMKDKEDILVFYKSPPTYNPQGLVDVDREVWNSVSDSLRGKTTEPTSTVSGGIKHQAYKQTKSGYPRQVLAFASGGNTVHPTQKPVALMEYLIRTYTHGDECVLDMTMGSGTTGVACVNTSRHFIGIEQDPSYFAIAERRIATAQQALALS